MDHSLLKIINSHEIPSLLEKASLFGGKIAQPTPATNIITAIKSINIEDDSVTIKLFEEVSLEEERPISIKLNYRNVNFQFESRQYSIEGSTLDSALVETTKAIVFTTFLRETKN
jgi:hypothetical protein